MTLVETAVKNFWDSLKGTMAPRHELKRLKWEAEQESIRRMNFEREAEAHQKYLERERFKAEPKGRLVTLQQEELRYRNEFGMLADRVARDAQEIAGITGAKAARSHLDKTDKLLDKSGDERIAVLLEDKRKLSPRMTELRKLQKENHLEQERAEAELQRRENNR